MICPDCKGEVSVPSGAHLRCGCGNTKVLRVLSPAAAPSTFAQAEELPALLKLMRDNKALKLVTPSGYSVELSPEAFAPAWNPNTSSTSADTLCRCGHSRDTHHNPEGMCLEGCEPESCAEKAAA